VLRDSLPTLAVVQLHPIVFSIFDFAAVLEGLSEQIPQEVVIGCIFETKVSHIGEVLVELI
jgi:hypothetical protein